MSYRKTVAMSHIFQHHHYEPHRYRFHAIGAGSQLLFSIFLFFQLLFMSVNFNGILKFPVEIFFNFNMKIKENYKA